MSIVFIHAIPSVGQTMQAKYGLELKPGIVKEDRRCVRLVLDPTRSC